MSSGTAVIPPTIRRKWDAMAIPQLLEEMAHLHAENERLQRADSDAYYWHDQYMELQRQMCDEHDLSPSLTVDGQLILVPNNDSPCADAHSLSSAKQAAPAKPSLRGGCGESPPVVCTAGGALEDCYEQYAAQFLVANESY